MATNRQLTELFQAIAHRDWTVIDNVADAIVVGEEKKGRHNAARSLRGALQANGVGSALSNGEKPQPNLLAPTSFLARVIRMISLSDVELRKEQEGALREFVHEAKNREFLKSKGLKGRTKLVFHGPPGCGKSMTASAIATELALPLFVVRFDSLIASFLGQTAVHLRQLFRFIESTPSVLLIDEIDALGRRRGSARDVGELDRIVISLMQELEHSVPAGVVVATTNVADDLDDALWRRFDLAIEFPLPKKADLAKFVKAKAANFGVRITKAIREQLSESHSYAEAEKTIESAARRIALKNQ